MGILHSLIGTMAVSETALVDATLMAIAEINDRGGVLGMPIEPAIEDGASDPTVFRQKAEKLLHQDRVATVFGCWTSLSRKAVKPVFEQYNGLLWYPVQYEGLEQSPNIFYTGSCPNQQVTPAVDWLLAQNRTRFYLIGSDYVFPRTVNKIVKGQLHHHACTTVGEAYASLGETDFHAIIQDIQCCQPDVVFSTLNGDSNLAFYQQYQAAGITADDIPIMAVSIAEGELQRMADLAVGHYAAWSYFQSIDTVKNHAFVQAFKQRYGSDRVTSDPIEAAYTQVYLWKQAVSLAKSVEIDAVRAAALGQTFEAPGGWVRVEANHHLWKECYIGKILPTGQFEIVSTSDTLIKPLPWLGIEEQSFPTANVVIDLLQEVSQGIQYSWELEQQSNALDQKNREMASYIEQVQTITDAAAAVEQERFDPGSLTAIAACNDDLGQLARVLTRMVETVKTRERELADAKEQLEAVLNAVPGSISWIDSGGVYIGVNRHLADNFNLTKDAFIGKEIGFLQGSNKLATFLKEFIANEQTSATAVIDLELSDTRRYYLVAAQKYQQGGATVSVGIDITERKLAEEALQQSEARNRALLNAIPDLMVEVNTEGVYVDAIEAKTGQWLVTDIKERVGKRVDEVLPAAIAQQYMQAVEEVLQSGKILTLEYEFPINNELQTFEARVTTCRENTALFLVRNISDRKQAEAALVNSEKQFRSLVANIPGAIYRGYYDVDRTMEYINDPIQTISGYPASDFIDNQVRTYASIIHPDDRDLLEVIVDHGIITQEPYMLDYRIVHRDGSIRWVYEQGQAVFDGDNNPRYLDGVIFDITERKQAEEALKQSEATNRALIEAIPDLLLRIRGDGVYLDNPIGAGRVRHLSGERIALNTTTVYDSLPPAQAKQRMDAIERTLKTKTLQVYEHQLPIDGRLIDEEVRVVVTGENEVLVMVRDISDRKQAEEALRIAEENYRSIFENALEGIFQSSPEGRFINVNPAMARIYRYDSPQEMIDTIKNISTQIYVDPTDQSEFQRQLEEHDQVNDFEYRVYQKDGDIIWIQEDARAVRDNTGQLLYYEGMIQDITDRKRREDELRRQLEELKIEIDQKKREKEVAILTESSYFQEVQQEMADVNLDEFWS